MLHHLLKEGRKKASQSLPNESTLENRTPFSEFQSVKKRRVVRDHSLFLSEPEIRVL